MDHDAKKLDAFMGKMVGNMTGGALCWAVSNTSATFLLVS